MAVLYEDKLSAIAAMERETEKLEKVILEAFWHSTLGVRFMPCFVLYLVSTVKSFVFAIMSILNLTGGFMTPAVLSVSSVCKDYTFLPISHHTINARFIENILFDINLSLR